MIKHIVFYVKIIFVICALSLVGLQMCGLNGYAAMAAIGLCIDMVVMSALIIFDEMTS